MNNLSFDPHKTWAFLIGNWEFQENSQLPNLPAVENNLTSLKEILIDPLILGIPKDQIISLKNQSDILQCFLSSFPKLVETLIVYYAGHGLYDSQQKLYFALPNSSLQNPKTGFPFENLWEEVTNKATNIIFILDCCYSGKAFNTVKQMVNRNISILTATLPNEKALAPTEWTHTAFTSFLIKTLKEGISNSDQHLTAFQIFEKIKSELKKPEPWHNDFLTTQSFYVVKNQGYLMNNNIKNTNLVDKIKHLLKIGSLVILSGSIILWSIIYGISHFKSLEKPENLPTHSLSNQLQITGLGKSITTGEYVVKLNLPISEKSAMLKVEGDKPLKVTLSGFPSNIFYSNLYDNPPTIKPNEQSLFNIGIKLSLVVEQAQPEYQFAIESGSQKILLKVELNEWVKTITSLLETVNKKLSTLKGTLQEEHKVTFELIQQIFPKTSPLIQIILTGQALQLSDRPQAAALAYFEAEKIKPNIAEQFLTGQQNSQVRTEMGRLYLLKQNTVQATNWFNKAFELNNEPVQQLKEFNKDINKETKSFTQANNSLPNNLYEKVDMVFVIDTTASMKQLILATKKMVINSIDKIAHSTISYNFGLVEYKDIHYIFNNGKLIENIRELVSWIDLLSNSVHGGGTEPEGVLDALINTIKEMKWRRENTKKFIILVTDAPPHDAHDPIHNPNGYTLNGVINELCKQKIIVHVIGDENTPIKIKQIAKQTGGDIYMTEQHPSKIYCEMAKASGGFCESFIK